MKSKYLLIFRCLISSLLLSSLAKAQQIVQLQSGKPASIRGLSVVDDSVAWISGSKGNIALTKDGGKTWAWQQVKGYEKSDFRDIEAFSAKEAVIMSSGTPAVILKTTDGGENWALKYINTDSAYFFDAMDFFGKSEGWIMGDAINNKFLLLKTSNSGDAWSAEPNQPSATKGEGGFAASGTCLRTCNKTIYIVSGGLATNLITANARDLKWTITPLPFPKSKVSQGAFSIAIGKNSTVITGGDYSNDKRQDSTACYSVDKGLIWQLSSKPLIGFQSCVEYIDKDIFLSTGTPGSNITLDGGKTWTKIDDASYNVCRKAKHGKLVLLAGGGGKIGILKM
jgi:photosystem II stability/assembly factor-like uncharacterized protein